MKERRERSFEEIFSGVDVDDAIAERFKMERHPEASVDGDNPWDRDLFEEDEQ